MSTYVFLSYSFNDIMAKKGNIFLYYLNLIKKILNLNSREII